MPESELNLESVSSPTITVGLPHIDRIQGLKQLNQINRTKGQDKSDIASLAAPNTAHLFESRTSEPKNSRFEEPHSQDHGDTRKRLNPEPEQLGNVLSESHHTTAKGETLAAIARERLGPKASENEVLRYAWVVGQINGISDPHSLRPGDKLDLPGHTKDGTITCSNPDNKHERWNFRRDGVLEGHNHSTGTSFTQTSLDEFGSYQEHDKGPKPEDNYVKTYINKDHYTLTSRTGADGKTITTGSDGYLKVTDKNGNWKAIASPAQDPAFASYDKAAGITTQKYTDGSTVKVFDQDNHTEAVDPNGTKTSKWADGTLKIEKKDAKGRDSGFVRHRDGHGGYTEHGWGPEPKDNFDETYSAKTGTTIRTEGKGTPAETKTTRWADGTVKVEAKDGKNYQRNPDGSEHHWGTENYDKPAFDFKRDKQLNQSRELLNQQVTEHIPVHRQAAFRKDMSDFEARAQRDHLSPEEVAKTYDQVSKLLGTPEQKAFISGTNRDLLAQGLMHQCAHPGETDQGNHNTCNVTTVLKETLARNPSKAVEMAATTAVDGQWTPPDGHTVVIDRQSLQPQAEESVYPPGESGDRSYATQVLNLVMVNDALQRRPAKEYYVQRTPDRSNPDDTGERRLDAEHKVITAKQYDSNKDVWRTAPDGSPGLTDREVGEVDARLNGTSHVVSVDDPLSAVESIKNEHALANKLHQLKQQGEFPIILAVDGHHVPIQDLGKESPSYGGHFVNIDAYDEKTGRVHVSNQWGKSSNRWVSLKNLYRNASGDCANAQDGVNTSDYQ